MESAVTKPSDTASLREHLSAIEGVENVFIDTENSTVCLILRADVDPVQVQEEAAGATEHQFTISAAYRPERRDRQRVRFMELKQTTQPDQQVAYTVRLEWAGSEYTGTAVGEKGEAIELRTISAASLAAIAALVPHDVNVRLAGVKMMRAFDAEMVVVSLYRPDDVPHNLVGAVVAGDDPRRAAATAVLAALNRLLGNYLALP
jgi:D-alanyl-D-alanine dipeptidase